LIVELKAIDTVYNGYRFRSLNFPVPPTEEDVRTV
jgi:hypothetical protein